MRYADPNKWKATTDCPMPDLGLVNWIRKYARENYWRVARCMELRDLHQEGAKVYAQCFKHYGVLPPNIFMSLFMQSFNRHVADLSKKVSAIKSNEVRECDQERHGDGTPIERLHDAELNNDLQGVLMVIADAPSKEVRQVLATFLGEGSALIAKPIYKRVVRPQETPNQYVCRVLGFDPKISGDILRQTKQYLYGHIDTGNRA